MHDVNKKNCRIDYWESIWEKKAEEDVATSFVEKPYMLILNYY
jgi:hypothetical protein